MPGSKTVALLNHQDVVVLPMKFGHLELFQRVEPTVECIHLNLRAVSLSPSVDIRQNSRGSDSQDVLQVPLTV